MSFSNHDTIVARANADSGIQVLPALPAACAGPRRIDKAKVSTGHNSTTAHRDRRANSFGGARTLWNRSGTLGRAPRGRLAQRIAGGNDFEGNNDETELLDWITSRLNRGSRAEPAGGCRRLPQTPRHRSRPTQGGRINCQKSKLNGYPFFPSVNPSRKEPVLDRACAQPCASPISSWCKSLGVNGKKRAIIPANGFVVRPRTLVYLKITQSTNHDHLSSTNDRSGSAHGRRDGTPGSQDRETTPTSAAS